MEMNLTELKKITDVHGACTAFGQLLGLKAPVSREVLIAALEDEDYARNLLLSRRNEQMMTHLLRQPLPATISETSPVKFNNFQLIGKAAKALMDWGKTGFSTVDDNTYEKRMAACERCDQLEKAPDKLVYKISLKKAEDKRTCKSCGCVVSRKARLVSDTCPLSDPGNQLLNRWGEVRGLENIL